MRIICATHSVCVTDRSSYDFLPLTALRLLVRQTSNGTVHRAGTVGTAKLHDGLRIPLDLRLRFLR